MTFSELIVQAIRTVFAAGGKPFDVDPIAGNALYGCKQMKLRLKGDRTEYRIVVAPVAAPISIGGIPADEHFGFDAMPEAENGVPHNRGALYVEP